MSNDQSQSIRSQLSMNEKLLWIGQPKQGLIFRKMDALYLPAGVLACWLFFGYFWKDFYKADAPLPFKLFIFLFTAMLLYQWFGRFLFDAWTRKKTFYAVTDERVLAVFMGMFGQEISTLSLNTPSEISLSLKRDGRGTILFTYPVTEKKTSWFSRKSKETETAIFVFELIPDAQKVYDLIRNAQKQKLAG